MSLTTLLLTLTTTLLTTTTFAAPTSAPTYPSPPTQPATASITLIDATSHEWTIAAPSDYSYFPTNIAESISHVRLTNEGNVPCHFFGVDGLVIESLPGDVGREIDVGPPQVIVGGICGAWLSS